MKNSVLNQLPLRLSLNSAVEVQRLKEEHDGESSDRETVEREMVEAPVPSFHSPSKKPKRQLAASFMNITKE